MRTEFEQSRRQQRLLSVPVVVVIPYYNGSSFIERSAQSVLDQTVKPAEFIVVDDGSDADEATKLDDIASRMGFRVLRKANGGQGSARNAGVAAARSEFICFLDQDDFFLRNHIETLIDAMPEDEPHFGWVYGELFEAERDGSIVRTSIVDHLAMHPKATITDIIGSDMFVLPSASLIARKAFEHVGGFDEQFIGYEDDDLFGRLFRAGFTNHFTRRAVTVWCIHTESTSHGIRMARSRLRYFRKLVASYPDDPAKKRFYVRDMLIPRFHHMFLSEAIDAATEQPGKFTEHRDEYINIVKEYADIVLSQRTVSLRFKARLRLRIKLLSNKSLRRVYNARPAVLMARRVASRLRRRLF